MCTCIHTYNTYMYIIIHIYLSIPSGHLIPNSSPPQTICDALLTSIKELPWSVISQLVDGIVTVSDDEVITAMKWIMERMKVNYYIIIKYSIIQFLCYISYMSTFNCVY